MHGARADLSLLLLSNSDITRSLTFLKVRGMRNISSDTISTKLFAIGVPVNNTLRRQLRDSRRLGVESNDFGMAYSELGTELNILEIVSPVAAAGRILDVVRFIERQNIKRDGAQKRAVQAARVGFKVGVSAQDVTNNHSGKV